MKAKAWIQGALLVLAGAWIYAPALRGGWIWDDRVDISENPVLRDPAGWWKIWFAPRSLDYYPLKTTVQWVQWRFWGLDPLGYHLTNLGLHLLSGWLIWRLLRRLARSAAPASAAAETGAWLGAMLFVVHPLAVESVAWIVELKNTLSLPLLLGAAIAYVAWDDRKEDPSAPAYVLSLLLFLAAMLSKTAVVMFPAAILLHAWWKRGRIGRRDGWASAPFFAVSLALGLATIWLQQHRTIGTAVIPLGGPRSRLASAGLSAVFYLEKFFWPAGLSPVYGRWPVDPPHLGQFWPWAALAAALGFCLRRPGLRSRAGPVIPVSRHVGFGLGFFVLNLVPILGFVTVSFMRFTSVMDHLAYLPMLGLAGLCGAGAGVVEARSGTGFGRTAFWIGAAAVFAALAADSRRHAAVFRDETALWGRAVAMRPGAWPAHNNLGIALAASGRLAEAEAQYREALRIEPGTPETHYNLALVLGKEGREDEAIAQDRIATGLQPDFVRAHFDLAEALSAERQWPEAAASYRRALQLDPWQAEAHNNLGNALNQMGQVAEAMGEFEAAIQLDPADAEAHNNLGVGLAESGRLPEAIVQFETALKLRPDYANARNNLRRARGAGP